MNNIIKEQLKLCKLADVPSFNDDTTKVVIKKKASSNGVVVKEGHCYLIELADYIIHPNDNFNLHKNWNNNVVPDHKQYKCECTKIMGKFVKIYGVGYDYDNNCDTTDVWSGWVPLEGISILSEL